MRLTAVRAVDRPRARASGSVVQDTSTADFAVTPLITPKVRKFVESDGDFKRSLPLGRIIVPLVLLLLIERELLAAGRRPEARTLLAFALPLISLLAMLVLVRLRAYVG
jgi:hypothetical protein